MSQFTRTKSLDKKAFRKLNVDRMMSIIKTLQDDNHKLRIQQIEHELNLRKEYLRRDNVINYIRSDIEDKDIYEAIQNIKLVNTNIYNRRFSENDIEDYCDVYRFKNISLRKYEKDKFTTAEDFKIKKVFINHLFCLK